MPVVGFLPSRPLYMTAFRQGLKEAGFVEGQDVDRVPLDRGSN
jgi:hypothetical protein